MRFKDYGRNPKKRKEYVQQPSLLLDGIDVIKAKHDACIATQTGIIQRKRSGGVPCSAFKNYIQTDQYLLDISGKLSSECL